MNNHEQPNARAIVFFTCVGHALTHIYIHYFTAILEPLRESFGLGMDEFTRFASISTVLFGLGALPAGWLGDRYGEKSLLVAFFLLTALGGTLLSTAHETWQLSAAMALIGLGTSIYHPVGISLLASSTRNPGRALGFNGLFGSLGTAASPFLASWLTAQWGWRLAYLVLTPPTVLLGIALAFTRIGTGSARRVKSSRDHPKPAANGSPARAKTIVLLLLAAMCAVGFVFNLVVTMLPMHLGEHWNPGQADSLRTGGTLTALLYAIGGTGQLLTGQLLEKREGRGLYVLLLFIAFPVIYSVGHTAGAAVFLGGTVMTVLLGGLQPIENVLLARFTPPGIRGQVYGWKFILVFGVGGLGTAVSGRVASAFGSPAVFTTAAAVTVVALALALAAVRTRAA